MNKMIVSGVALAVLWGIAIGNRLRAEELNTLTEQEKKDGWQLLFDGKTTAGWRGFRKKECPAGWKVVDGALTRVGKGGDIVTTEKFDAFELSIEYKIAPRGNSGIMYHVTEEEGAPFMTGPEIQVLDNKDGGDPQKAGWLYQLYKAETDAARPAGQWNHLRILVSPAKCETHMNGVKYCEYVKGSKDWDARVAASKFGKMKKFGKAASGHIDLQDHGAMVAYRNIKIRKLPTE